MKPEFVKFKWEHFSKLRMRDYDKLMFGAVPDGKEQLQKYIDLGVVYSGIVGNETIMIGGVCMAWNHVGFAWVLTSELVKKYKVFFHKSCKKIIELGIKHFCLHRLETTIIEGHEISKEWAERIGFENEGLMRKYDSHGRNYYLYAKII